jgi:hypothetical protein
MTTFTTYKPRVKKGKFHLVHVPVPSMHPYSVTWIVSVLTLHSYLLTGNSCDESTPKTDFLAADSLAPQLGKDSKTVNINDSFNLDTIPLDVDEIIDIDKSEDPKEPNFVENLKNLVV